MYTVVQVPVLMQTADTKITVRIFPGLMLTYTWTNTRGYLHWQSASSCSYQLLTVQTTWIRPSLRHDVLHIFYRDLPCFQNIIRLHSTCVSVISFTTVRKLWPSLLRSLYNAQSFKGVVCISLIPNFTHVG
jgi:hypothetical protein